MKICMNLTLKLFTGIKKYFCTSKLIFSKLSFVLPAFPGFFAKSRLRNSHSIFEQVTIKINSTVSEQIRSILKLRVNENLKKK